MTTPDASTHSLSHRATGGVTVREPEEVDGDDAMFEVRMPIASTGEVRNEGDEPLTRDELGGMARQIREREIGVFTSHGSDNLVTAGRYSQLEKLGVWTDATIDERESEDLLMATARMPDPEELPAATGEYRQALAIVKEQAKAGIPMDASIGWRDDDASPGGVDLMEASIVGIGADPRTNTGDDKASVVARAAADLGVDGDALAERVREVAGRNLDDPAFSEGDAVSWDWQGDTVHGRVAGDPAESVTVGGQEITGDDGEAVYPIHEYDEEVEAFRRRNVAKPESSLSESQRDLPPANEENFQGMTDDDTGDDPGTTDEQNADDGETRAPDDLTEDRIATFAAVHYDGMDESDIMALAEDQGAEFVGSADVEELYDLVSVVTGAEYDAVESAMDDLMGGENEGDKPDDYDDEEDDEEQAADPEAEQDADDGAERDAAVADLRAELDTLREELTEVREGGLSGDDVETPEAESEREADDEQPDENGDETPAEIRVSDL